jgi:hypothetical protein
LNQECGHLWHIMSLVMIPNSQGNWHDIGFVHLAFYSELPLSFRLILVSHVQISGTIFFAFLSAPDIFGSFPGHGIFGQKYDSC